MKRNPYRLVLLVLWVGAGTLGAIIGFSGLNSRQTYGENLDNAQLLATATQLLTLAAAGFLLWLVVSAVAWSIHAAARGENDEALDQTSDEQPGDAVSR